jgi:hypothetical protein
MAHWAESGRAEMLDRGTGRAGSENLTWGYEWTDPGSDDHLQVTSKAGGESRIWALSLVSLGGKRGWGRCVADH